MNRYQEFEDKSDDNAEFGRGSRSASLRYLAALLLFLAALVTLLSVDAGDDKTVDRFLAVILVAALVAAVSSVRR